MCNESDRSDRHHIHGKVTLLKDQCYILCISIYTFISPNLIDWDTRISLISRRAREPIMAINPLRFYKKNKKKQNMTREYCTCPVYSTHSGYNMYIRSKFNFAKFILILMYNYLGSQNIYILLGDEDHQMSQNFPLNMIFFHYETKMVIFMYFFL